MATNWWRRVTNPLYLTDDELDEIVHADGLVLSLAPVPPAAIPANVWFGQIIGVVRRVWVRPWRFRYHLEWVAQSVDSGAGIDWSAIGRDHERNIAVLAQATATAKPRVQAGTGENVVAGSLSAGQLSEEWKGRFERGVYDFIGMNRYWFGHGKPDIYLVQLFEQRAWSIRFLVRGEINGVQRTLISHPALETLSLDLTTAVPTLKRARSMLEADEY